MEQIEKRTGRMRFLKQLGVTLAAAVGAGAFASAARATAGLCCRDCSRCPSCGTGQCYCYCDCTGIGESYCLTTPSGCFALGHSCVTCGC
jgi:hypothetical protein